jgi:hypothetical protein
MVAGRGGMLYGDDMPGMAFEGSGHVNKAKEEALRVLAECSSLDTEAAHRHADGALCDLLIALGHEDVVLAWREIEKWYA